MNVYGVVKPIFLLLLRILDIKNRGFSIYLQQICATAQRKQNATQNYIKYVILGTVVIIIVGVRSGKY